MKMLKPYKWLDLLDLKISVEEKIFGIIQAVKCFEDNSFVRKAVEQNRDRKVWAGDGDGSLRYALLGYRIGI